MKIAMLGHKRIPSREGGVEIVVEELATRMVAMGHQVVAYNRKGNHVSDKSYTLQERREYKGVNIVNVFTLEKKGLNALIYSFFATIKAVFGKHDVIHYHAEGSCAMIWIPKLFGIRTVATIHGLDWKRAKWGGFATRYLLFGEKMAAKYADEVVVLSKNMQKYFMDTYKRETKYIPNGISLPTIKSPKLIKEKYNLDQNLLGNMICDNFDLGVHLDYYIDENGVKRYVSEVVEYVAYGKGTFGRSLGTGKGGI